MGTASLSFPPGDPYRRSQTVRTAQKQDYTVCKSSWSMSSAVDTIRVLAW